MVSTLGVMGLEGCVPWALPGRAKAIIRRLYMVKRDEMSLEGQITISLIRSFIHPFIHPFIHSHIHTLQSFDEAFPSKHLL